MAYARLVAHYARHNAWPEDESLLRGRCVAANVPGILVNGRLDVQAPIGGAWDLHRAWPRAKLVIVDDAGHDASNAILTQSYPRNRAIRKSLIVAAFLLVARLGEVIPSLPRGVLPLDEAVRWPWHTCLLCGLQLFLRDGLHKPGRDHLHDGCKVPLGRTHLVRRRENILLIQ